MKTIKYKSGRITLYHKDNDKYFAGSLILEDAKSTLPKEIGQNINTDFLVEVLRENLSHNLDAIIRTLHSKTDIPEVKTEVLPEPAPVLSESTEDFDSGQDQEEIEQEKPDDLFKSDPPISGMKPGQPAARNILKEYWDLLDFPALFKYLLHTASAATSKISKSIKTKSIIVIEKLFYSEKKEQEKPKVIEKSFKGLDLKLAPKVTCLKNISAGYLSEVKRFAQTNSQILVKGVAIGCLVISVLSIGSILLPLSTAQIGSMVQKSAVGKVEESQKPSPTPDPQKVLANSLEVDPSKDVPASNDYVLEVPKIGLVSDIAPNVDLEDEKVYKQKLLETGVAHAKGSYFPGEAGPVFLFAHSTDTVFNISAFNAKFFALRDLADGDLIELNYQGKHYTYKVTGKTVIDPKDLDAIRDTKSDLILQTCWPPGTDWQRLVVFAEEQEEIASIN